MKWLRDERGSVLVEVALALPMLATLLAGAVDYGLLLEREMRLQSAAAAAAAFVSVPVNSNNLSGAQQVALADVLGISGARASAQRYWNCSPGGAHVGSTSQCPGPRTPMQWVQVDAYASGALFLSVPGLPAVNQLHVTVVERVPWKP